jgi:hypothetical protein
MVFLGIAAPSSKVGVARAPFPSVAMRLIEGYVLEMMEADDSRGITCITAKAVVELAGAFSSSNSRGTEDTVLLLASEMAIVGMIAGREMVGAVGTVAVGMVAGMVEGGMAAGMVEGGMAAGMAVGIAACMVMAGIGTVVEEGMLSAEADVVGSIGGRLGVGLRAPSVGYVE